MNGLVGRLPAPSPSARVAGGWILAAVLCGGWAVVTLGGITYQLPRFADTADWLLFIGPTAAALGALLARPCPPWLLATCGFTVAVAVAVEALAVIGDNSVLGFAPLALAAAALVVADRPVLTVAAIAAIAGTAFSVKALTGIPAAVAGDGLLAAAWVAVLWSWLTGVRAAPRWMPVAFVLIGLYVAVSAISAVTTENDQQGLYGFRFVAFYLSATVLVAYFVDGARQRAQSMRALILIGAGVLAYAMFRLVVGPAADEQALVQGSAATAGYVSDTLGEVRLFGSLAGPYVLGTWASWTLVLGAAAALCPLAPLWRGLGLAIVGMSGIALLEADSRSAMMGAAAGVIAATLLFSLARAFAGRKAAAVTFAVTFMVIGGGAFVAVKLADDSGGGDRFRSLLNPFNDISVQTRITKWNDTLDEVSGKPFGNGVGASGHAEQRYARFSSLGTFSPDSAYVKVIYDQGVVGLALWLVALIAVLVGLGSVAIRAPGEEEAFAAIAAAGMVVALLVECGGGAYQEGQPPVYLYLACGLGLAPLLARRATGGSDT